MGNSNNKGHVLGSASGDQPDDPELRRAQQLSAAEARLQKNQSRGIRPKNDPPAPVAGQLVRREPSASSASSAPSAPLTAAEREEMRRKQLAAAESRQMPKKKANSPQTQPAAVSANYPSAAALPALERATSDSSRRSQDSRAVDGFNPYQAQFSTAANARAAIALDR